VNTMMSGMASVVTV